MYNSVALSTFTLLCKHHPSPELSVIPNQNSVPIKQLSTSLPPQTLVTTFLLSRIVSLVWFHMDFRIFFFYKNSIRILIGVLIESIDHLGRTDILTILNLPINEHGLSFHLCFLWFLPSVFCSFRFFMSLVKFIYKHFVVVVNGIVFFILIFWGFCLLLVYINTTDVFFFFGRVVLCCCVSVL